MKLVTGNTFPVKDQLKSLGGKWNAIQKGWDVPDDKYDQAVTLVNNAPKSTSNNPAAKKPFIHYKCKMCGCAPTKYNRIYRNGMCKDCFVSEKEEREMGY